MLCSSKVSHPQSLLHDRWIWWTRSWDMLAYYPEYSWLMLKIRLLSLSFWFMTVLWMTYWLPRKDFDEKVTEACKIFRLLFSLYLGVACWLWYIYWWFSNFLIHSPCITVLLKIAKFQADFKLSKGSTSHSEKNEVYLHSFYFLFFKYNFISIVSFFFLLLRANNAF